MSRRSYELRKRAEERWPNLVNILGCYFNEDFDLLYGSLEGKIEGAVCDGSLAYRQAILKEWRDWQTMDGSVDDIRPSLDRMGVDLLFKDPEDARAFMNLLYDRLIERVRAETGKDWRP
jgi:hypothetical protein